MEEPNNNDNDENAVFAGFVAGGSLVADAGAGAGAGAGADVNNNEAVVVAAEANENATNDDVNTDDEEEEQDQLAIQKLLSVLQQREDFPVRQRNKIIELAHEFVNDLGADVKDMVTDKRKVVDGYAGLDSDRDTKEEVETALRHYPETLSERGGRFTRFPIQCITLLNPMAVAFVVLFAQLAIEFNSFADEERGGLFIEDGEGNNVLARLVQSSYRFCDKDYHQLVDTKVLKALVQLQRFGLFKKEDIQRYQLVHELCKDGGYFAENWFHFLTNSDPSSLVQLDNYDHLPLHFSFARGTIQQFQVMLACYLHYYTKENVLCLLFQKDNDGYTPFQNACEYLHKHKTDLLVHDAIEQSLGAARFSSPTTIPSSSSSSSLNIGTVLKMAARNDNISLDGWY